MAGRDGRVQRQAYGPVVVHRKRRRSRPQARQLGGRTRCAYCGEVIVLGFLVVGERRFRRAVDVVRRPRLAVPQPARFVLVRTGQVYKPRPTCAVVNPWHLFTCTKQPPEVQAMRDRVLARYDTGVELVLATGSPGDMAGGDPP